MSTWRDLFERAATVDVTGGDIEDALAARRGDRE